MNEKDFKLTDLDYATGDHHLQMMKAALPYMAVREQRSMSLFIKFRELFRTMEFFRDNDEGMLSVCDLGEDHTSAADMLSAIKPYANPQEQEMIELLSKVLAAQSGPGTPAHGFTMDQLLAFLPQEKRSQFETMRLMMQTMGQMT